MFEIIITININKEIIMTIGEKITHLRNVANISQEALAEKPPILLLNKHKGSR